MTIEEWDVSELMDWSRRRDEINPLFYAIVGYNLSTYNNLTTEQKIIGAKYFLVPYSLRVGNGIFTDLEDKENWLFLLIKTKESRVNCVEAMRLFIGEKLRIGEINLVNTQKFIKDVFELIKWFNESNAPDFKQWIINEIGSKYEFKGFKNTSYWSQEIQDGLMNIYNGEY